MLASWDCEFGTTSMWYLPIHLKNFIADLRISTDLDTFVLEKVGNPPIRKKISSL